MARTAGRGQHRHQRRFLRLGWTVPRGDEGVVAHPGYLRGRSTASPPLRATDDRGVGRGRRPAGLGREGRRTGRPRRRARGVRAVIVTALLEELRSRDIRVWADGDQLRCSAPTGVLTPDLRNQLRERKADNVEFLHSAEALALRGRAIVPLQSRGTRAPIFGVPGHHGDVFCYPLLAPRL